MLDAIGVLKKYGINTDTLTSTEINRMASELFLNVSKTVQNDTIEAKGRNDKEMVIRHNREKKALAKDISGTIESNLDKILTWHTESKKAHKAKQSFSLEATKAIKKNGFEIVMSVMVKKIGKVAKKATTK